MLKGSYRRSGLEWWGLLGRMTRRIWPTVRDRETEVRTILREVQGARESAFPDIAVKAMERLNGAYVRQATATLLLTLARPDRLLVVNAKSESALGGLSGVTPSTLRKPEGYGNLLQWLYDQPWYADGPPADEDLVSIWRFRAALIDAFVYEP